MVLSPFQDPCLPEEPPVHGSALGFSWLTLQSSISQKVIWKNTDSRHLSLPKPGHAGGHCAHCFRFTPYISIRGMEGVHRSQAIRATSATCRADGLYSSVRELTARHLEIKERSSPLGGTQW